MGDIHSLSKYGLDFDKELLIWSWLTMRDGLQRGTPLNGLKVKPLMRHIYLLLVSFPFPLASVLRLMSSAVS